MSVFEHMRTKIFSKSQHPLKHASSDISYSHDSLPGVTTLEGALTWMFSALYPNTTEPVADNTALAAVVGMSINDYTIVTDDGDGKAAGYSYQQREGDVSAQWYKVADLDWGVSTIVSQYLMKTQDAYVYRYGYDDTDENGDVLTGDLAGQHLYGGDSASTHLILWANSGDGTGAATGFIQAGDDVRPLVDSTLTLGTTAYRWADFYTDTATSGTLTMTSGSITDTSGDINFGDENLTTTGILTAGSVAFGTLALASGSITDTSGAITFGDENLDTSGTIDAGLITVDNLRINGNTIDSTDTDGAVNILADGTGVIDMQSAMTTIGQTVTGTMAITGILDADNLRIDGNTITSTDAAGDINLHPDTTGSINLHAGALTLDNAGVGVVTGSWAVDNILTDGNTISSTDVNGDINLTPNGTGNVVLGGDLLNDSDGTYDIGATALRFNDLFLFGGITDGTTEIPIATIVSFFDVLTGVNDGDGIFWDNGNSKWIASNPDAEIDHGELLGSSLADDDHTQYCLLVGRSGGTTIIGGTGAGDDLLLESTSHGTKGQILCGDDFYPDADVTHDLGGASNQWEDLYLSGQAFGLRVENFADTAARTAVTGTEGRLGWQVDTEQLWVGLGAAWKSISTDTYYNEDASGWTGSVAEVSYDVSASVDDAYKLHWQFKDNGSNYEIMAPTITHTSATNVTVTFGMNLDSGTYTLVGR